ncbi:Sugar transporter ERD6-like 5 [Glycine soja]
MDNKTDFSSPLLPTSYGPNDAVDSQGKGPSSSSIPTTLIITTLVAVFGSYVFGSAIGYSSPTQSAIMRDLNLGVAQYSIFGSILTIGAMIGAVVSGRIADYAGRRVAMGFSQVFCILGWLAITFSKVAWWLYVGRLLVGCGIGLLSYVVPVYVAEITPKNLRGTFTAVHQLMICCGMSLTYLIGAYVNWRILATIGIIPCLVQLLSLPFIPDSPRWLAKAGRLKESDSALQRLRGKNADVYQEATEIRDHTEAFQKQTEASIIGLFQMQYLKSLTVGVGLMILQQFGGINGIVFYANSIFISSGFSESIGTIAIVAVKIPMTTIGVLLMDKSGRRPLLLVSAVGTCVGCFLAALSFVLQDLHKWKGVSPILALVGVLVYVGSYSIGMGAIPWVIMSEIFPINVKGSAGSLVTLVSWLCSWIISYAFNFLMSWSSAGTFFMFSGICGFTVLFVAKLMGYSSPAQTGIMHDLHLSLAQAMGFSEVFCILGSLIIAFSKDARWLCIGRLLIGCGISLISYVVPVYIAEIAPKNLRGAFTEVHQLLTLPFIPDSPRWLVSELFIASGILLFGHYMHFGHRSLDKHSTSDKCNLLQAKVGRLKESDVYQEESMLMFIKRPLKSKFTTKQKFFSMTGFSDSIGTIAMVAVKIPLTTLGVLLMDKCGRRPLLLIFPINVKGSAGSVVTLVNWSCSWIVSYAFNFLMSWSSEGTFFIFSSICGLIVLFVAKLVPETKSRTLEEIQASLYSSYQEINLEFPFNRIPYPYTVIFASASLKGNTTFIINQVNFQVLCFPQKHKGIVATMVLTVKETWSVGYSSPAQTGIMDDLNLGVAKYSLFGSILTIGAMIGAIISGRIADYAGRRTAMGFSEVFCILGWLVIAFSKVPVYIAEITPKNLRGGFTTVHQELFHVLCNFWVYSSFLSLLGGWNESVLQCLRGKNADISQEATEIGVGVGLMILQQFGGVNDIAFCASSIFISAGFSGSIGMIAMVAVQIPMTALGVLLMDKSGRRPLLLDLHKWKEGSSILTLVGVLAYTGSFLLGMGGIPLVIMSEIFPINVKGSAGSLVNLASWLCSWIVSYAFNFLMSWSSAGTFFIFSIICGFTILFVAKLVPETRENSRRSSSIYL